MHSLPEKSIDAVGAVVAEAVGLLALGDKEIVDIAGWTLDEGLPVGSAVGGVSNGPTEGIPVGRIVTETLGRLLETIVGLADGSNFVAAGLDDGTLLVGVALGNNDEGVESEELGFTDDGFAEGIDVDGILEEAELGFREGTLVVGAALGNNDGNVEGGQVDDVDGILEEAELGFREATLEIGAALGNNDGTLEDEELGFPDVGFAERIRVDDTDEILVECSRRII